MRQASSSLPRTRRATCSVVHHVTWLAAPLASSTFRGMTPRSSGHRRSQRQLMHPSHVFIASCKDVRGYRWLETSVRVLQTVRGRFTVLVSRNVVAPRIEASDRPHAQRPQVPGEGTSLSISGVPQRAEARARARYLTDRERQVLVGLEEREPLSSALARAAAHPRVHGSGAHQVSAPEVTGALPAPGCAGRHAGRCHSTRWECPGPLSRRCALACRRGARHAG